VAGGTHTRRIAVLVRLAVPWTDPFGVVHAAGEIVDIDAVTLAELEEHGVVDNVDDPEEWGESESVTEEDPGWMGPGVTEEDPGWMGPGEAEEEAADEAM
jgi:hypothetical protein